MFFFLMRRRPPRSTRTDTLFPYTTLFRSRRGAVPPAVDRGHARTLLRPARPAHRGVRAGPLRPPPGRDGELQGRRAPGERRRPGRGPGAHRAAADSEEHTSELPSLMRISYAVFCLKKKTQPKRPKHNTTTIMSQRP